jgi:serine protease Do
MPEFRNVVKGVEDGVVIETIQPNSPAAKSELRPSDVILTVDGKHVSTAQELRAEVRTKKIGQPITLEVFRSGKAFPVKVNAGEWADPATLAAARTGAHSEADPAGLGITVHPMNRELANQFGIETGPGLIIVGIEKGSIAADHGIKPGDVVTAVNQQPVSNVKQFHEALKKADLKKGVILNLLSGDVARFEILRQGSE